MIFEIGKTYRHTTGKKMTIIGRLKTHAWGECLIGETDKGDLVPVGEREENALNWSTESEGMENNKLNRIKEGHKFLSLLELKELKDCIMVDDTVILYYGKGDVFLIKAYSKDVIEAIGNRDINRCMDLTLKESED